MKKTIAPLLCIFAFGLAHAQADDVAVMSVLLPKEKKTRQVVIEFFSDVPATAENFETLARKHFYNGLTFHRVFPHTLVQAGDPFSSKEKNRAKVGTSGPGYTLAPEIKHRHTTGAVAMARLPDTGATAASFSSASNRCRNTTANTPCLDK
jgi:cyclophilin family peptidyl-prolyl cis-trans isomerase